MRNNPAITEKSPGGTRNNPDRSGWRLANRIWDRVLILVFVSIMLPGLYSVYDSVYLYQNGRSYPDAAMMGDGASSTESMPDQAVGWIEFTGTKIAFPVMQGPDNEVYLNRDAYGNFALTGSVFLDYRNDAGWQDSYNLLYGHHMSENRMFGSLDAYLEEDYLDAHRDGVLKTRTGNYRLKIIAVARTEASDQTVFAVGDHPDPETIMAWIDRHALIRRDTEGKKLLAMSTCQDQGTTKRLIVFAEMIPEDEKDGQDADVILGQLLSV